jgi:hypothetical protein
MIQSSCGRSKAPSLKSLGCRYDRSKAPVAGKVRDLRPFKIDGSRSFVACHRMRSKSEAALLQLLSSCLILRPKRMLRPARCLRHGASSRRHCLAFATASLAMVSIFCHGSLFYNVSDAKGSCPVVQCRALREGIP